MKPLLRLIRDHPAYRELLGSAKGKRELAVSGLKGSAVSILAACLREDLDRPVLLVTSSTEKAEWFLDDLETFGITPLVEFPVADVFAGSDGAAVDENAHVRTAALCRLADMKNDRPVGVVPIQAAVQSVPAPVVLSRSAVSVAVGDRRNRDSLAGSLVDAGFENMSMVEVPGEFSVRGSIVDIYSYSGGDPLRVEFTGDQIESIRTFDPGTQESVEIMKMAVINVSRPGVQGASCVADHFPRDTVVMLDEPAVLQQSADNFTRAATVKDLFSFRKVMRTLSAFMRFALTALPEKGVSGVFEIACHGVPFAAEDLNKIAAQLAETAEAYKKCLVMCDTDSEVDRLKELFGRKRLPKRIGLYAGRLQQGFAMPETGVCVLTSHEMFNRYRRPRSLSVPKEGPALDEFAGIDEGDYVVHVAHGIGRFEGLKVLQDGEGRSEYLVLRYADEAKVYVPVSQMLFVQKYVGGVRKRPRLSKIRGTEWAKRKEAARLAAKDLAVRLLRTQASRVAKKRKPYAEDDNWQHEFEAAFRFTETDDQLRALRDIKHDLTDKVPMDRLICGDVGYGKTEIAMRAMFKVVNAGKQAALLAPTTILVQQHYRTFKERMAAYPVRIEGLSRFRTDAEQRAIVESLAEGTTDIIIGTHRLLQKDVVFDDIGLVIIDEEQRFGVEQKEHLKRLRETVDILTLTATPIPRTLHMSLLGLRDISALKTPPRNRLAIETRVIQFDEEMVRDGILRELNRNGQVYFIHNRVHNIKVLAKRIERIVPEARIAIGHGQMAPRELETTMSSFLNGEIDVLVATTIIESGLDIPSVNTIFVNRADDFGLADLHQLRGRVGRYKHHAYAYFILPEKRPPTPRATRRLKAIEDFAYLGAGFDIAMRDLEIRGAGNILGREQHGHIAAVGYGMYCRLLERSVGELRGTDTEPRQWVDMRIGLAAFIPGDYIEDTSQRLEMYKRLSGAGTNDAIESILKGMKDRFGQIPGQVEMLAEESKIRIRLSEMGVMTVQRAGEFVEVTLREHRPDTVRSLVSAGFVQVNPSKLTMAAAEKGSINLLNVLRNLPLSGPNRG